MVIAFARRKKHPGSLLAFSLVLVSALYAFVAIACFFLPTQAGASKFAGTVGFVILFLVVRFFVSDNRKLRFGIFCIAGVLLAILLAVPTRYWKVPLLTSRASSMSTTLRNSTRQAC